MFPVFTRQLARLLVIIIAAGLLAAPTSTAVAAGTCSITGQVSVPAGYADKGYGFVHVFATSEQGEGVTWVGWDGKYELKNLNPGVYTIKWVVTNYQDNTGTARPRPNLLDEYWKNAPDEFSSTTVDLRKCGTITGINATLDQGRTISGTIGLPSGFGPETYKAVTVFAWSNTASSSATVDSSGRYTLDSLPAGKYQIFAEASDYYDEATSTFKDKPNLISQYYPGVVKSSDAQSVDLTTTTSRTGVSFPLVGGRNISGTITLPSGMGSDVFQAVSVRASSGANEAWSAVDSAGRFSITNLVPGRYTVEFTVGEYFDTASNTDKPKPNVVGEFWKDSATAAGSQTIDLTSTAAATNINATLDRGRTISGRVTVPPNSHNDWAKRATASVETPGGDYVGYATIKADGTYQVAGLAAGQYVLKFSTNVFAYGLADEWYDNAATREDAKTLTLSASDTGLSNINAQLDRAASFSITTSLPAKATEGSFLLVDDKANVVAASWIGQPQTKAEIIAIPAGTYRLAFAGGADQSSWQYVASTSGKTTFTFKPGDYLSDTVVVKNPDASIRGTMSVSKFSGNDACGGCVDADRLAQPYLYQKVDGQWLPMPSHQLDTLAAIDNGDQPYTISGVAPGTYTVKFAGATSAYAGNGAITQQWWKGSNQLSSATPVTVGQGATVTGIDGSVSPVSLTSGPNPTPTTPAPTTPAPTTPAPTTPAPTTPVPTTPAPTTPAPTTPAPSTPAPSTPAPSTPAPTTPAPTTPAPTTPAPTTPAPTTPAPSGPPTFKDVSGRKDSDFFTQFLTEIEWMATSGLSTGYGSGDEAEFRPRAEVKRDAMAAFLYRASGSPEFSVPQVSPFADVPTDHPFYREIVWLYLRGVSTGWERDGKRYFRPRADISRDAMAAFLYRTAGANYEPPSVSPFVDVPVDDQFYVEIAWMKARGLSTGWKRDNGKYAFVPGGVTRRDAMAAFLYRFFNDQGSSS